MIRRYDKYRRGYVLVLTLATIALAAISLAGLARYSLQLATSADEAASDLQHRWGLVSVRHVLADRAEVILAALTSSHSSSTPPWPKPARAAATFRLGTFQWQVLVADEDAKVNLNTIYRRKPKALVPAIRRLCRNEQASGLVVAPMPENDARSAFASWGQVFALGQLPAGPADIGTRLMAASHDLTCWSSERLNLRRASDAAVREVAGLVLPAGQVGELISLRKHWGGENVAELLVQLELRSPQVAAASRLLATTSSRYSLWVTVDRGQRSWQYQFLEGATPVSFAW